jgi:hypothetical protein
MSDLIDLHFVLRIHVRTPHFGETEAGERAGIARLLHQAAQEIQSGAPATHLRDSGGHVVGDYEFGPGMLAGPGPGFDKTHRSVPPASMGGKIIGDARARKA